MPIRILRWWTRKLPSWRRYSNLCWSINSTPYLRLRISQWWKWKLHCFSTSSKPIMPSWIQVWWKWKLCYNRWANNLCYWIWKWWSWRLFTSHSCHLINYWRSSMPKWICNKWRRKLWTKCSNRSSMRQWFRFRRRRWMYLGSNNC